MARLSKYLDSHFTDNFFIKEVGVKLDSDHYKQIRSRLSRLAESAPAFSFIDLKFSREGQKVRGELKVNGVGKNFQSEEKGEDPLEIYLQLEQEIEQQLFYWKKVRFLGRNLMFPDFSNKNSSMTGGYAI